MDLNRGQIIRVRSFEHIMEDGTTRIRFSTHSRSRVFVMVLLGEDDKKIAESRSGFDVVKVLNDMGWHNPDFPNSKPSNSQPKARRSGGKRGKR